MEKPLISIAIPVYNAVKYIEETINNFLQQTYKNIEVVVQDDCSTDGTWELMLRQFSAEPKVKLERNHKNLGIGPNWNRVYDRTTGEYVVIANADDIHKSHFLEKAFILMRQHAVDFVTFKYQILHDSTKETHFTNENKDLKAGIVKNVFDVVFFNNPYHIIFTLFRRNNIEKIKIHGQAFLNTQICDFELMLRFAKDNILYYDDEIIGYYRLHTSNNSKISLAEFRSFYNGFIPVWHNYLKNKFGYKYRKRHLDNLIGHLKASIKGRQSLSRFAVIKCLKYYFL